MAIATTPPPPPLENMSKEALITKINRLVNVNEVLLRDIEELQKIIEVLKASGKITSDQINAARSLVNLSA